MNTDISLRLESFELQLIDIAQVDLAQLHALSIGVRWPHRPDDWRTLLQIGRGLAAVDDIGRVIGSAMWFPYTADFATVGMVITSPRMQEFGAGRWLMDRILEHVVPRSIALNSTRAARRLYKSLGFIAQRPIYQCQGEVVVLPAADMPDGATTRLMTSDDFAEISQLDIAATGIDRHLMLEPILAQSKAIGLMRDDRLVAYALCRQFGRGHVVGPMVAASDADAIAVMAPHVADHAGRFLRVDTVRSEGEFAEFIANAGLVTFDIVTAMTRGRETRVIPAGSPQIYGLTSQALG